MTEEQARQLAGVIAALIRAEIHYEKSEYGGSMGTYYEEKAVVETLMEIFPAEAKES